MSSEEVVQDAEPMMIKIEDKEGNVTELSKEAAQASVILQKAIAAEDFDANEPIKLSTNHFMTKENIAHAVSFMEHFAEEPMEKIKMPLPSTDMRQVVQKWYADFILQFKREELYVLMNVANDLQMSAFMTLCSATVAAEMMKMPKEDLLSMFSQMGLNLPNAGAMGGSPITPASTPNTSGKKKKKSGKKK
mmetsp:Transcript_11101/g.14515  ORF Transcript_11101/g.14515 Transcript_11101/m.14515 type:complete len:191 (+) Transcript_11101:75-647(+)